MSNTTGYNVKPIAFQLICCNTAMLFAYYNIL